MQKGSQLHSGLCHLAEQALSPLGQFRPPFVSVPPMVSFLPPSSLTLYPHRRANLWAVMFKPIRNNRAQNQQNLQITLFSDFQLPSYEIKLSASSCLPFSLGPQAEGRTMRFESLLYALLFSFVQF